MNPTIIFENKDLLVINKPSGLVIHPDGRTKERTLCDWLMELYPSMKDVGEPILLANGEIIYRPGIVHRLDRDTSGVMVVAKTPKAFEHLKAQFKERETEKTYNVFVYGEMKEDDGVIDRPIGKSRSDFRKWSAQRGARGEMREAITHFRVLERGHGFTFLEAMPRTGRTHQIRVHFAAVHHPVVSDKLYASSKAPALGFKRVALHARKLTFHDFKGKAMTFEAPLVEDFEKALKKILS